MKLYYAIIILVYKPPLKEARKLTAHIFPSLHSLPILHSLPHSSQPSQPSHISYLCGSSTKKESPIKNYRTSSLTNQNFKL